MQDLINEEEFIEKKSDYNPWRGFGVFYGVTFVTVILLYCAFSYIEPESTEVLMVLLLLVSPLILSFAMIFSTRKNLSLPYKIIFLAIVGQMGTYMIGSTLIGFYNKRTRMFTEDGLLAVASAILTYIVYTLFCFALIYPILRYKRKRLKQRL